MLRALLVTTLMLAATPAFANEALDFHNRARLAQQGRLGELQILRYQQRRLQFHSQEQRYREQDRAAVRYRPERFEVPRMQRNCQVQPYGSHWLTSCR